LCRINGVGDKPRDVGHHPGGGPQEHIWDTDIRKNKRFILKNKVVSIVLEEISFLRRKSGIRIWHKSH
jgi:hypothetical protein